MAADKMLCALIEKCAVKSKEQSNGLLLHTALMPEAPKKTPARTEVWTSVTHGAITSI